MIVDPDWAIPAGLLLLAGIVLVLLGYRRTSGAPLWVRTACVSLKLLAFALLALALWNPVIANERAFPGMNDLVILLDNSASMQLPERNGTRLERMRALFDPEKSDWLESLRARFNVHVLTFGEQLRFAGDSASLDGQELDSALDRALADTEARFRERPVAGVLLFTDGAGATPVTPPAFPIHSIPFHAARPQPDLIAGPPIADLSPFEAAPVRITQPLEAFALAGQPVTVTLRDEAGEIVATESWIPDGEEARHVVEFEVQPTRAGTHGYTIEAAVEQPEWTTRNNRRHLVVNRRAHPYRLLYVTGRPNWEHKFLQRALEEDRQLELVSLVRLAKREPRFTFRRRQGESTNPLFRGAETDETAERYDEPVLVRLNTRDAEELRGGFPKLEAELFAYDAVILDDVEAGFFSPDQMQLLDRFVRERGGSLLLMGGAESLQQGGYARTPVAGLSPVYLEGGSLESEPRSGRLTISREGWLEPWVRLEKREPDETRRMRALPPVKVLNEIGRLRPGALPYLMVETESGESPALAMHTVGKGAVMVMPVGDFWRTGLASSEHAERLARWWRQCLRRLVTDVPERLEWQIEPEADGEREVRLEVRDQEFQPDSRAVPESLLIGPDQAESRLILRPSTDEPGVLETELTQQSDGPWMVEARLTDPGGGETLRNRQGWAVDREAEEFRAPAGDREKLAALSTATGGRLIEPTTAALEDFAKQLEKSEAPVMRVERDPVWHSLWYFLAAIGCLIGEWALRRTHRLP